TDASANDTSDGNFKIRGNLTVSVPNGGEVWIIGSAQTITWTSAGTIPSVKLEYSKDNFATVTLIAASVGNTGSFAWTVPDNASTTVKVRVTNTADATVFDDSNANFTIRGGFILSAPNGGEEWVVGSTHQIAWTTTGSVPSVKLEYSTDNFATATVIVASTANTGSFGWVVPDAISTTAKIRVSDAADSSANDVSDNNFKIRGGITVSAPNGGE